MKRLLFAAAIIFATLNASAQASNVDTVTITKGYGNFQINNAKYPLNSVIVNIPAADTTRAAIVRAATGTTLIELRKRYLYRNGTTGKKFASITEFRTYCDSFLFSH